MTAPVVTVRGEGRAVVAPDLATIAVTVHSVGDTAHRARDELAGASAQIAALILEFVRAIERSGTIGLHVAPVFHRRAGTKITGYRGTYSTEIVLSDFEVLSPILSALSAMPSSQIDGPIWSLRPSHPVYRRVRLEAIDDARRRADDYAAAFGATVVGLVEITDVDARFAGGFDLAARELTGEVSDERGFDLTPLSQEVSGQVTVRFTITTPDLVLPTSPNSPDLPDDPLPAYG